MDGKDFQDGEGFEQFTWLKVRGGDGLKIHSENNRISYNSDRSENRKNQNPIIKSREYFSEGDISFKIKYTCKKSHKEEEGRSEIPSTLFEFVFNQDNYSESTSNVELFPKIRIGINKPISKSDPENKVKAKNVFSKHVKELGTDWKNHYFSQPFDALYLEKEYHVRLAFYRSQLSIFVNGTLVASDNSHSLQIAPGQIEIWMGGDASFEVTELSFLSKKPTIFVVIQFTKEFDMLYEDFIEPIATGLGFQCHRSKDLSKPGMIIRDIEDSIMAAFAIIADVTFDNPNVFYEIGYARALKKPLILLANKEREKLPFDISGFRTIFYENTIVGRKEVVKSLEQHITNVLIDSSQFIG